MLVRAASLVVLLVGSWFAPPARGQLVADTLFTWQGYGEASTCRVRMFLSGRDQKKPHTVVVGEVAENRGASTLDDVRHLVDLVGRSFGVDPEEAFWIFHWGGFSYPGSERSRKEIFLRGTFRWTDTGSLGAPFWRIIGRETVVEYTDRAFH